jgi:DNA-binding transcriptional ArsR family regulator
MNTQLSRPLFEQLAERFRALAEPNRLAILSALRTGERTVTGLMDDTGLNQANLSKHLRMLHQQGYVARRKEGLHVFYRLRDEDVFRICDIVCSRIETDLRDRLDPVAARERPGRRRRTRV